MSCNAQPGKAVSLCKPCTQIPFPSVVYQPERQVQCCGRTWLWATYSPLPLPVSTSLACVCKRHQQIFETLYQSLQSALSAQSLGRARLKWNSPVCWTQSGFIWNPGSSIKMCWHHHLARAGQEAGKEEEWRNPLSRDRQLVWGRLIADGRSHQCMRRPGYTVIFFRYRMESIELNPERLLEKL